MEAPNAEIHQVAEKFVVANALNPQIARLQFPQDLPDPPKPSDCNDPKFEGEPTAHKLPTVPGIGSLKRRFLG